MKFIKNILIILIINLITFRRYYNLKNRFFHKLKTNNAKTFDL